MSTNEHNARVIPDIRRAIVDPEAWCISGRCRHTNWGGRDRLHTRQEDCPEHSESELRGYLVKAGNERLIVGETVASIIAPGERYGRVVGLLKRGRKDKRVIVREFVDSDGWFPTGDYRYTAPDALTPWPAVGEAKA